MAIQPVKQQGVAFSLRQGKLFTALLLHKHVEVRHQYATSNRDVHRFRNAILRELKFIVRMGERIRVVPVEFTAQVKSHRLAQIEVKHRVRRIRAGNSNLVTLFAELFHAEHTLLVQIKAHPLVGSLQNGLVHAVGVVFFNDVNILETKDFCSTDNSGNVMRVKQVFKHHAKVTRTTVDDRGQQFATAFRDTCK